MTSRTIAGARAIEQADRYVYSKQFQASRPKAKPCADVRHYLNSSRPPVRADFEAHPPCRAAVNACHVRFERSAAEHTTAILAENLLRIVPFRPCAV